MLESSTSLPRSPRSPRSPRLHSPLSARDVALDLDDAFSTGADDDNFSALDLPSRAELERMAAGQHWNDDADEFDADGQYARDVHAGSDSFTLELPPSPITFRRSLSPSPSPSRINGAAPLATPDIPPVSDDEDIASLDAAMEAVDLQDSQRPAALELELTVEPAHEDVHPYPDVHIDVAHRTVKSISSLSAASATDDHAAGHSRELSTSLSNSNLSASASNHSASTGRPSSEHSRHGAQPSVELPSSTSQMSSSASQMSNSTSVSSMGSAGGPVRSPRSTTSSHGPSALEKVLSKTRPTWLPPKDKEEDNKHLKDWEDMMRKSRAAEEKRKALVAERRRAREAAVEASIPIWEREIVPDWRAATRDPRLRSLWWNGIPSNLRGQLWEQAIGNDIALSKDSFLRCSARGRRARESGVQPLGPANLAAIEADIASTLPSLHIFKPTTGPMYEDLRDILCAFMIARSDEGLSHYVAGTARAAAMLLLNLPPPRAFIALRNLLERHCLRSFYGGEAAKEEVDAYYRIFDTLLADCMPKIYFNFKQHHISPAAYLPEWIIPIFVDHLPVEACTRVWDGIVLHGDAFLFRVALALLSNIEMRLFFPDRKELMEVLRGENRAAQEVARRTGVLGPESEGAGKYAQYGVDEESVWQRIVEMDDWWKESTWARLIQRELPDL